MCAAVLLAAMALSGTQVLRYFPLWLAGCVVAVVPWRLPAALQRMATVITAGVLLVVLVVCLRPNAHLYLADVAICTVFTALLWVMVQNHRKHLNGRYVWCAQGLARISYTLYATHLPLLVFACAWAARQWKPQTLSWHSGAQLGVAYAVVFALSIVLYMLFERNTVAVRRRIEAVVGRYRNKGTPGVVAEASQLISSETAPPSLHSTH